MADENNTGDEQFTPDGSMEPLSPQEADTTDYGLMDTGERIQRKDLQQEMRESYLAYALSVIVERALPDVRDGMKPVHRRVIYAMYDGGYRPDRGYNKCSRVVGDVMGKYHPHGDSAIYDTLVRMAQAWSMRNMLVDGQGNFGSPGDDPAAAMRYTECRMAPLAMEMVRDIDKDTVDFVPNYDGKTQEPTVLPARNPNQHVNGYTSIAHRLPLGTAPAATQPPVQHAPAPAPQPIHQPVAVILPTRQAQPEPPREEVPKAQLTPDLVALGAPETQAPRMSANNVTPEELQHVVGERGYFPEDMPIKDYPMDFVEGCLIAAWPQVLQMVLDSRDLPF